jgi:hypothetical protein
MGYGGHVLTTSVTMELDNLDQYALFKEETDIKCRLVHNGPIIESTYRYFLQGDTYGKMEFGSWGELAGTNRTITFVIQSEQNVAAGFDHQFVVQCERTA